MNQKSKADMITDYDILEAESVSDLIQMVNSKMRGTAWQPLGVVQVCSESAYNVFADKDVDTTFFYQTMVEIK